MSELLQKEDVSHQFVRVFTDMIVKGEIQPDSRIESEADISDQFGISRSVVREGLRELSVIGLITKSQGKYSSVTPKSRWNILNPVLLTSLLEFDPDRKKILNDLLTYRMLVECQAAADAAIRWTEQDLKGLSCRLKELDQFQDSSARYIQTEFFFHTDVHQAAHNLILYSTLQSISEIIRISRTYTTRYLINQRVPFGQHQAIYKAISTRNADDAREAMRIHILWSMGEE